MNEDQKSDLPTHVTRTENEGSTTKRGLDAQAQVYVVSDLDKFEGAKLEDKIDTLIDSYPVVMFNRTWCVFSLDAQNFLVGQMGVPVHSMEVDKHPQGKDILKYIYEKTSHKTTPAIFIKGEFLGGFEEVNSLYAQGKLEKECLEGLSQADRCEVYMATSHLFMKPYFWFPERVDGNVVRATGVLTFSAAAISIALELVDSLVGRYISYALAADFFLRLIGGAKFSVFGRIALFIALPFDPMPRVGRPKQFATILGFTCSLLSSIFYLVEFPNHQIVGSTFIGILALATFMEGFFDFCIGCTIFKWGVQIGLLSK